MGFEIVVKVMINTSHDVAQTGGLMVEMFEKLSNPLMMFCSKLREATVIV